VRALAFVTMCGASYSSSADQVGEVTIGQNSPSLPAAASRIANELGLFAKHGINAKIIPMDSASVTTMGVISGSLEFETSGPTDVVVSQARGQQLVAVASIYSGFAGVLVLSKPVAGKLGVSPEGPVNARLKALDGLLIATPSATSTYTFALKSAAEAQGAHIKFIYMAQPAMVAALKTGAVQGFMAGSPVYAGPILDGSGVLWIDGPKRELPNQYTPVNALTLNTRRDFAIANKDLVSRMAAVYADLAKAFLERPSDVKAAIHRLYPDLSPATLDLVFVTESHGFTTKPLTVADMAHEIQFVKASGIPLEGTDKLDPASMVFK
jgi:ABC-type nitrate/sulfonate/bicarbonate transport system substrate-binding protein